tara:strand:+ start:535 stop:840 length:306 start_codon:yes stop_codon:yes gene_type:complete
MARKSQIIRFESDGSISDTTVAFTAEEEAEADIAAQERADNAGARAIAEIRKKRDKLLLDTDWWALPDLTMSDKQKTYRQALRDYPASWSADNSVAWPTKP